MTYYDEQMESDIWRISIRCEIVLDPDFKDIQ